MSDSKLAASDLVETEQTETVVAEGRRDHRTAAARAGRSINKLIFPHENEKPDGDQVIEVADGVLWARIPLPWSLDHINIYLFDEGDSWSLVDTGSMGKRGRDAWEALLSGPLAGDMSEKPIKKIVCTHMHPDHLGLAGWLVERFDAEFYMTMGEYLTAQLLWTAAAEEVPDHELDFLWRAGVSRNMEPMIRSIGYSSFKKGVHKLPGHYKRLEDGSRIMLGGRDFTVVIGRGHSPEHACLWSDDGELFVSGDQVLPTITSNVSVYSREPDGNPLAHWLSSLDRLKALKGDPLVLPSHGKVFKGLHIRLDDLIAGHIEKLGELAEFCTEGKSAVETFPALYSRKISGLDFFMGLGEALAHLNFLLSIGVMEKDISDEVDIYRTVGSFDGQKAMAALDQLPGIGLQKIDSFLHQ